MPEEAPNDFRSDSSQVPLNPELNKPEPTDVEGSRLFGFLKKVNQLFNGGASVQKTETRLEGRIYEIQKDYEKAMNQLASLREELMRDEELELPSLITVVLDPLIKEMNRTCKPKKESSSAAQQVMESKKNKQCMDKVQKWINLCANRMTQKEKIYQELVEHIISDFHARIDRDLQVIQDYVNHSLDSLDANDLIKAKLRDALEQTISQDIFELYLLKEHPKNCSLEILNQWQAEAEAIRENHFSSALHQIDVAFSDINEPRVSNGSVDLHLIKIDAQLKSMDEKLIFLVKEFQNFEESETGAKKKKCLQLLNSIEENANDVYGNLRSTHEQIERVQKILETLTGFREKLLS